MWRMAADVEQVVRVTCSRFEGQIHLQLPLTPRRYFALQDHGSVFNRDINVVAFDEQRVFRLSL